jgi:hypothetical protein
MNLDKKIGETSKGFSRIYLEGSILSENGFNAGDRYDVKYDSESILLSKSATGKKKVSKKVKNGTLIPVVDLCDGKKNQNIRTILGGKNTVINLYILGFTTIEGLKCYHNQPSETLVIKKG